MMPEILARDCTEGRPRDSRSRRRFDESRHAGEGDHRPVPAGRARRCCRCCTSCSPTRATSAGRHRVLRGRRWSSPGPRSPRSSPSTRCTSAARPATAWSACAPTPCATLCGGDAASTRRSAQYLGVGHDETTADGTITLEHAECLAACDYAPVIRSTTSSSTTVDVGQRLEVLVDAAAGRRAPARPRAARGLHAKETSAGAGRASPTTAPTRWRRTGGEATLAACAGEERRQQATAAGPHPSHARHAPAPSQEKK